MQFEHVRLEDVYPPTDEYGNVYLSRDYTKKANREYVDALAEDIRTRCKGKPEVRPEEPIVLVRDGGLYVIKSGQTRVRALRKLGVKTVEVAIDEGCTKQELIESIIATNTKKKYEPEEDANLFQQLAMVADVQRVAEMHHMDVEKARRIKKGTERVGGHEGHEGLTLERYEWIGSHEWLDADELASVENAAEKDWRRVADGIEAEHRMAGLVAAKVAELEAQGVTCVTSEPDRDDGWFYVPEKDACPACVAFVDSKPFYNHPIVYRYCRDARAHGREKDPAEAAALAEAQRIAEERKALDRADAELRTADVMGICEQKDIDALLRTFARWFVPWISESHWACRMEEVPEDDGWKLPALACRWMEGRMASPGSMDVETRARLYVDWVNAVQNCSGYQRELTPNEERRLDEAREAMVEAMRASSQLPDPDPEDIEEVGF